MDHILLKPNLHILSKHYEFSDTPEMWEKIRTEGFMITPNPYYNNKNHLKFGGEHLKLIEREFKALTEKYDIADHYDNLLFLALSKYISIDETMLYYEEEYMYKKRSKELASLLLALKTTPLKKFDSLQLRTNTDTIKVTDKHLCEWLGKIILEAVNNGKEPVHLFGLSVDQFIRGSNEITGNKDLNLELLMNTASMKLKAPHIGNKKYVAQLCLYLYPYLINETSIRPNSKVRFSDKQLNFYFDMLTLFEMVSPKENYDAKDYMRTSLKNYMGTNRSKK